MAHQDQGRKTASCSHAHNLHRAVRWLLTGVSLAGITLPTGLHAAQKRRRARRRRAQRAARERKANIPRIWVTALWQVGTGIEVYYRHCKQTYERRKLRSQNPDNALVERHWALLGM